MVGCSPHRDHAISANPGGGVRGWLSDFTGCNTTSWVRVVCEVIWAVVVVHSTDCLTMGHQQGLLGWAKQLLLQLQSHGAGLANWGRAGSASWGKLISTQLEGRAPLRTSSSIKETSSSIACQSSNMLSTKQQGLLGTGCWVFFHPLLKGLHIGEGLLQLSKPVVSTAKLQFWRWHTFLLLQQ